MLKQSLPILLLIIAANVGNYKSLSEPYNRLLSPPITPRESKSKVKEYVYEVKVKKSPELSPTQPVDRVTAFKSQPVRKKSTFYRVEVPGDSARLLHIVQKVEPKAFISRDKEYIQVGMFKNISDAQKTVKRLTLVGLPVRTIKVYR